MDLICENYFEKKYERRIESFEKETLLGIFEIIDKMHKHAIEDYKNVIDAELTEEDGKITDSIKFEKVYSKQFYSMFEHIAEDFQWRLKDLKSELEKRLDIRYKNESNNESDNESDNKSDNESESESKSESESESKKMTKKINPLKGRILTDKEKSEFIKKLKKRNWLSLTKDDDVSMTKPDPEINQKLNSDQMT